MSPVARPLSVHAPSSHVIELASMQESRPLLPPAAPASGPSQITPSRLLALRIALGVSAIGVVWVLWPYWGWLVLAAWFAALARPGLDRLSELCGGRRRAAALLTIGLSILVLAPAALVIASLTSDAVDLVGSLFSADSGRAALTHLAVRSGNPSPLVEPAEIQEFARAHADRAFELAVTITGSVAQALLGLMVLFSGVYVLLVEGPALFTWLEGLAPASHRSMIRLRDAFIETGRGLLI